MSTPELLKDLLVTIQCLQKELAGSDAEKVKVAQETYHKLLDGFDLADPSVNEVFYSL
jgi:hypothetical protein